MTDFHGLIKQSLFLKIQFLKSYLQVRINRKTKNYIYNPLPFFQKDILNTTPGYSPMNRRKKTSICLSLCSAGKFIGKDGNETTETDKTEEDFALINKKIYNNYTTYYVIHS